MMSYDANAGAVYVNYDVLKRRLTPRKALKMFKNMKEYKIEYIKDYNERFR